MKVYIVFSIFCICVVDLKVFIKLFFYKCLVFFLSGFPFVRSKTQFPDRVTSYLNSPIRV